MVVFVPTIPSPADVDADLLHRWRNDGDVNAFERLIERHIAMAVRLAAAVSGRRADADDIAQEAFIHVMSHPDRWSGRGSVRGWIAGIVVNRGRMRVRAEVARAARTLRAAREPVTSPESDDEPIDAERLWAAVRSLPVAYSDVISLRFQAGLDVDAIAAALDRPRFTVHTRLRRGLALLRKRLRATAAVAITWSLMSEALPGVEPSIDLVARILTAGPRHPSPVGSSSTTASRVRLLTCGLLMITAASIAAWAMGAYAHARTSPSDGANPRSTAASGPVDTSAVIATDASVRTAFALLPIDTRWVLMFNHPDSLFSNRDGITSNRVRAQAAKLGISLDQVHSGIFAQTVGGFMMVIDGDGVARPQVVSALIAEWASPGRSVQREGSTIHVPTRVGVLAVEALSDDRLVFGTASSMAGVASRLASIAHRRNGARIARRLSTLPADAALYWASLPWGPDSKDVTLWMGVRPEVLRYEARIRNESGAAAEQLRPQIQAYLDQVSETWSGESRPFVMALRPEMNVVDDVLVLTGALTPHDVDDAWENALRVIQ